MLLSLVLACSAAPTSPCSEAHQAGWSDAATLPDRFESHATVVHDGRLHIVGGYDFVDGARDEVYSAPLDDLGSWTEGLPLPEPLEHHSLVSTEAGLLVMGGDLDYGAEVSSRVYWGVLDDDGVVTDWVALDALPIDTTLHATAQRGDDLYLVGGTFEFGDAMTPMAQVTRTRLADGLPTTWFSSLRPDPGVVWAAAAVFDDQLVVTGGLSAWNPSQQLDTVWTAPLADDGGVGDWSAAGSLPSARYRHSLTTVGDELLLVGGDSEDGVLTEVLASRDALTWASASPLPAPRFAHSVAASEGGLILSGGFESFGDTRAEIWTVPRCFSP